MNTKHLKNYAPKARRLFMQAVENRLAWLGIYADKAAAVTMQGDSAIIEGRAFSRKQAEQRNRLLNRLTERGYALFVREMAYTWFNRLAALRFMELKDYLEHGFRVLSSKDGSAGLPEILDHAADVADLLQLDKKQIIEMQLAGNQQEALYRELLLGQCHYLHAIMPFMFEALDDATELLLPDNLTKTDSILKGLVEEIPEDDWQNIEVIGWLYQFYISEHKDAVIGKVVKSEDIPAATQLFTPNWIVKYLVQNSVGRQWLQTYPDSAIKAQMEYYIGPGEQPAEVIAQLQAHTPASIEPESIKVLDPACGSGHILVEVYELLREIYLERGYRLRDIPQLILTKNIFGLDIDDRAAQLSGFALMMKAREDDRRIFERIKTDHLQLNIFALQQTDTLDINRLWQALNLEGKQQRGSSGDLFGGLDDALPQVAEPTQHGLYHQYFTLLQYLKTAFAQAKTLGSLVQIEHSKLEALQNLQALLQEKQQGTDPAAKQAAEVLMPIVQQALVLAQLYDAVIANPPYMGSKGMNADLKDFAKDKYPDSKSDLFAIFIERGFELNKDFGYNAMVTMQSWMFLSSYESLRLKILQQSSIECMAHMGNGVMGIAFGTAATVCKKGGSPLTLGAYCYVENDDIGDDDKPKQFPPLNERNLNAAKQAKQKN
ncbi:MAG: BREX-1 system adenine-specific DNA-methyltransferase PglX [Alishewanella agri]|nr:BREX-1 system adenine-specific DNA-methyltransferase PglX [Alishewanella agri]